MISREREAGLKSPQPNLDQMREYWFQNEACEFVSLKGEIDEMQWRILASGKERNQRGPLKITLEMQFTTVEILDPCEGRPMCFVETPRFGFNGNGIKPVESIPIHAITSEVKITRSQSDLTVTMSGDSFHLEQMGLALHSHPKTGVFFTGWKGWGQPMTLVTLFPTQLVHKVLVENGLD